MRYCRLGQGDTPGSGETLLSWLNCDMDGSGLLTVAGWDDGFACAAYSSAYGAEAALLTHVAVEHHGIKVVTRRERAGYGAYCQCSYVVYF